MTRLARVALVALVAAVILPGVAVAADPTLGARITPAEPIVYERAQELAVENLSTIPVRVRLEADQPGWVMQPATFALDPGASQAVTITEAGEDDAAITATLTPTGYAGTGIDTAALVIGTRARHATWADSVPWDVLVLVGLLAGLAILWMVRRYSNRGGR